MLFSCVHFVFVSDGAKKAGRGGSGNDGEGKVEKEIKVEGSSEERQKYAKPQVLHVRYLIT